MSENQLQESLRQKIHQRSINGKPFFSVEFFPPRSESELPQLSSLLDGLKKGKPLFWDITWNTSRKLDNGSPISSMAIADKARNSFNHETVLHMTCIGSDEESLMENLNLAKNLGIKNILALRGDKLPNENEGDQNGCDKAKSHFNYAVDLVRFIRRKFGDYFTIIVAGYPDGHPESSSYDQDLKYLKEKIDAGADLIITQLSFSFEKYTKFIADCRKIGISVPIVPGIFPIQTKASLRNVLRLTQVEPPKEIEEQVSQRSHDEKLLLEYGIEFATDLCQKLLDSKLVPGLHFYTMNRDVAVTKILKNLNLWESEDLSSIEENKLTVNANNNGTTDQNQVCLEDARHASEIIKGPDETTGIMKPKKKSSILTAEPMISESTEIKNPNALNKKELPDKI